MSESQKFSEEISIAGVESSKTSKGKPSFKYKTTDGKTYNIMADKVVSGREMQMGKSYIVDGSAMTLESGGVSRWIQSYVESGSSPKSISMQDVDKQKIYEALKPAAPPYQDPRGQEIRMGQAINLALEHWNANGGGPIDFIMGGKFDASVNSWFSYICNKQAKKF